MSATADAIETARAPAENDGYVADGHVLSVRIADGYLASRLSCPDATCKAKMGDGRCALVTYHDDVGLEFVEWQHHPHREAELPCTIEYRWEGWDEPELFWRPVVSDG